MSDYDGEPQFSEHATEAADAIATAVEELTEVRAYVLSEKDMENFKQAQMGLRELRHGFDQYLEADE